MKALIFDFETNGLEVCKERGYKPYPPDEAPLPHANFPTQVAAVLIDEEGREVQRFQSLVRGASRLCPWVEQNCPHVSVSKCDRDGIEFEDVLKKLSSMASACESEDEYDVKLVAHNISYDWDAVLVPMVRRLGLTGSAAYVHLASMPRACTCINEHRKRDRSAYYWKKVSGWRGPKLSKLAERLGVEFDEHNAHDAMYDVTKTRDCFVAMHRAGETLDMDDTQPHDPRPEKRVLTGADKHLKRLSKCIKRLRKLPKPEDGETAVPPSFSDTMQDEFRLLVRNVEMERKRAELELLILRETVKRDLMDRDANDARVVEKMRVALERGDKMATLLSKSRDNVAQVERDLITICPFARTRICKSVFAFPSAADDSCADKCNDKEAA